MNRLVEQSGMGPTATELATSALLNEGLRWLDADTAGGQGNEAERC